jgi:hypothetical protein
MLMEDCRSAFRRFSRWIIIARSLTARTAPGAHSNHKISDYL